VSVFVQISERRGAIDRVRRGTTPVVELELEPNQRVVSIDLRKTTYDDPERKTVDWRYLAYVESRWNVDGSASPQQEGGAGG
jgi:hypothetical protein